jgi:hypothetical protein
MFEFARVAAVAVTLLPEFADYHGDNCGAPGATAVMDSSIDQIERK